MLQTSGRPVCIQTQSSTSFVRGTSSRPRSHGERCFHTGLKSVDVIYTPYHSPNQQYSTQNSKGQGVSLSAGASMGGLVMVLKTVGDANRLSGKASTVKDNAISTVGQNGGTPSVDSKTLALTVCPLSEEERLQAGFSEKVCKVLLALWRDSTTKRYLCRHVKIWAR